MKQEVTFCDTQEKAIHFALWINFQERNSNQNVGVIHGPDNNWAVVDDAFRRDMETDFLDIPRDYTNLSFESIRQIHADYDPLPHLEELCGTFSTMDGALLRFILHTKIPMKKLIRYELASRGYDENIQWVGFDKAKEIWLKE